MSAFIVKSLLVLETELLVAARSSWHLAILLTFLRVETLIFFLLLDKLISDVRSENGDGRANSSFYKVAVVQFAPKGAYPFCCTKVTDKGQTNGKGWPCL